jgi:hypothetical protein
MTTPTDDQLASLGAAFDSFARRYKLQDALGSETQLNELDKQTLIYVADHPECGPTDVARFLAVPNTTISSATDRLVNRGLLERHRPAGDRRGAAAVSGWQGAGRRHRGGVSRPLSADARTAVPSRAEKFHPHDHENRTKRALNSTNIVLSF